MEQIYMIEIFIDKVSIIIRDDDTETNTNKGLIVKVKFGPKVQFIVKEGQLAKVQRNDAIVECDGQGYRKWNRTLRIGKSYLFPSYPDTMLSILSKFPLEVEVWTDDENEKEIFVGVGNMHFHTEFFFMLKETTNTCKLYDPLSIKQVIPISAECCCKQVGDVSFIVRLSALGDSIITEFQQLYDTDPEAFVFRTNKAPSMFQCKRVDGEDPNFCMAGSLYETATLEDPDVIAAANKKIEVCTELQSCGVGPGSESCRHDDPNKRPKEYAIQKVRMGDITGPCGNANCPLAHKIKNYIRNLDAYQRETAGKTFQEKGEEHSKKVCGRCGCKDDRWHRETCPENEQKPVCTGCGGIAQSGETCEDRIKKLHGTGVTPIQSTTASNKPPNNPQVNYMTGITFDSDLMKSMFGQDFFVGNCEIKYPSPNLAGPPMKPCTCGKHGAIEQSDCPTSSRNYGASTTRSTPGYQTTVYNAEVKNKGEKIVNNFCIDIPDDKDCKCNPQKPTPPCKTFDCECLTEAVNIDARKHHKPYCPSYKHKTHCPVTMIDEEEKNEFEEDEAEPLPYGLPPVQLGPCPVLGRPCSVPDGFARMYKTAAMPTQPPSYGEAGRVCCSKEYERIKKAIKEYMTNHKGDDYRCINKFNVDTERRCCDKEQRLLALLGKSCCGTHKLAIQDVYKEKFIREANEKKNG